MGSPPRGRGKVQSSFLLPDIYGITPAWAGKREPGVLMVWQFQDHPRVGGEKILEPSMGVGNFGSPPHGRGKVVRSGVHRCCRGITPAWAGKRCSSGRCCMRQRDHPRVGGEKTENITPSIYEQGSPPRGRGKGNQAFSWYGSSRITPAWAGKRFWNRPWVWATSDHPRMGGEKSFDQACTGVVEGSPPHGRGKDVRQVGAVCGRGITPAWAGKRPRT